MNHISSTGGVTACCCERLIFRVKTLHAPAIKKVASVALLIGSNAQGVGGAQNYLTQVTAEQICEVAIRTYQQWEGKDRQPSGISPAIMAEILRGFPIWFWLSVIFDLGSV